jgi:hypothetical protein
MNLSRGIVLSVLLLLAAGLAAGCDGGDLNPFAPPPTATPTPTATPSPTATASATPTITPSPTATATPTNTPTPTPTPPVRADECGYVTWLAGGLLNLSLRADALSRDEAALHNTSIFDSGWRGQTVTDLAAIRDAAAPVRTGYGRPAPSALLDLDLEARTYAAQVYTASATAYSALNAYDIFAFNDAYTAFTPLRDAGTRLLAHLDSWSRGRGLSGFVGAVQFCRSP